jgi:AcrR family transcriptional regulator
MGNQNATRLRIVHILDTLMKHTPIEKVRVVDICRRAGISRTTFYAYFQDVFEVVTWMWDYLMADALYEIGISIDSTEGHIRSFYALLEHKSLFYNAYKSKAYNSAFEYGSRHVKRALIENAERSLGRPFTHEELLQIDFYNYGAAGMTRQWVIDDMAETPEEITEILELCMPTFLASLLNRVDGAVHFAQTN